MKKIKPLIVSVNFENGSGLGIVEHSIRLYRGIKKYSKNIDVEKLSLFSNSLFYMINKKTRNLSHKKLKKEKLVHTKPDIIHYASPGVFMSSLLIKPIFNYRAKQVVTIHDLDMINKIPKIGINKYTNSDLSKGSLKIINIFLHSMERRGLFLSIKNADHILCVSEETKKGLIRTFSIPPDKISVIYNVIGKEFKRLPKKNKSKKIIIGHLSSYAYNKNAGALIEAFKKVKSDNFELHLYGAKLPFDISDDKRIKYFGHAHNTTKMYNSFDVFAFPSRWEGFGMPVMEAKKCMVPVITYEKGELPEIVKRNTVQFKNVNDLTRILEKRAWKKVNLRAAYNDTKKCEERYVIKKIEEMYKEVMEEN